MANLVGPGSSDACLRPVVISSPLYLRMAVALVFAMFVTATIVALHVGRGFLNPERDVRCDVLGAKPKAAIKPTARTER